MFLKNKYDISRILEKILEKFSQNDVENIVLEHNNEEIEIYFEDDCIDRADYKEIMVEIIENLNFFNNTVQSRLEIDSKKFSNFELCNFYHSLSYINIYQNKVELCYWGDEVNNEFDICFYKEDNEWNLTPKKE